MMLDMRRTFDDMVTQHTTGRRRPRRSSRTSFYQTIASSFGGTQEYMAMEKLSQLVDKGDWDLVVVDTPPSRNALDFLDAPQRLGSFLDGRMIRLFMASAVRGIGRIVTGAMSLGPRAVSTIVGGQMLKDVSTFVESIDSMFGGFQERADRTYALLSRGGTHFLVVAAPEPDALREASFFVDRLSTDSMPLAGLVVNRTHPLRAERSSRDHALTAADKLDRADTGSLTASAVTANSRPSRRYRRARGPSAAPFHQGAPGRGDRGGACDALRGRRPRRSPSRRRPAGYPRLTDRERAPRRRDDNNPGLAVERWRIRDAAFTEP